MIMSVSRTASCAEDASRTPILSPAALSFSPAACGNRMSQAAMRSMPLSRRPEAMAWPASPKPMKETRGVFWPVMGALLYEFRQVPLYANRNLRITYFSCSINAYFLAISGVPCVWNDSMVFRPQAWPFLRSSSVQVIGFQSGASTSRAPALATSTRLPPGS